jgi:hypothetical protein
MEAQYLGLGGWDGFNQRCLGQFKETIRLAEIEG